MYQGIDNIINKYWTGESTLEEEAMIRQYLASDQVDDKHQDLVTLFGSLTSSGEVAMPRRMDAAMIIAFAESSDTASQQEINAFLEKYWEGHSSLSEEAALKRYFESDEVSQAHQELIPMFKYFSEETAHRIPRSVTLPISDEGIETGQIGSGKTEVKATKMRRLFPRVAAVAATLTVLLMATFMMMDGTTEQNNNYVEVTDADEALEITMEALAFLGLKYEKGSEPMRHFKQLEKTNIFTFE